MRKLWHCSCAKTNLGREKQIIYLATVCQWYPAKNCKCASREFKVSHTLSRLWKCSKNYKINYWIEKKHEALAYEGGSTIKNSYTTSQTSLHTAKIKNFLKTSILPRNHRIQVSWTGEVVSWLENQIRKFQRKNHGARLRQILKIATGQAIIRTFDAQIETLMKRIRQLKNSKQCPDYSLKSKQKNYQW